MRNSLRTAAPEVHIGSTEVSGRDAYPMEDTMGGKRFNLCKSYGIHRRDYPENAIKRGMLTFRRGLLDG